jgi:hypothetical protein
MKHLIKSALLAAILFSTGCNDDDGPYVCSSCVDSPEALAANDNSGKGIYKGLVVGSSGTVKINIDNDGDGVLSITLKIDNHTINLTTEASYTENGFEGYFYGTLNTTNDVVIGFYVNSTGTDMEVFGVEIPGHDDVTIEVEKEKSNKLIMVFEGTFSGDSEGTLNLVVSDDEWKAIARPTGSNSDDEAEFEGDISGSTLTCNCGDVEIEGSISGDNITGTWVTPEESGTWKAKRTL